ncbi:Zn(II)2Cys6 transcription factor Ecym_8404 [Eremothecium cymbalariae DBVPG|uniref:Zn(2)-C6 fungal-type domain-containing protein n=1 Tax=Eremothecium cymbalariae (strain CBS 270.75 / DBVPG 7215 / KCTC 17166 / NRRL Y-17582) TaxID=931890 RepID=G8JXV0_ERECY|nr:Hypothetical protein Ecym_8404 [Eremothecium cymbalariae DBVPG\
MSGRGSKVIPIKNQSAVVLEDGTIYKVQHKRQRRVLNCMPCHKRKVKCSRERPSCDNCLRNSFECVYFVNDRVSRGGQHKVPKESKQQLLKVIEKARKVVEQENSENAVVMQENSRSTAVVAEESATHPNKYVVDRSLDSTNNARETKRTVITQPEEGNSDSQHQLLTSSGKHISANTLSLELPQPLMTSGADNFQLLPSRERCLELLDHYKVSVHPILPLVEMDQFVVAHMEFWESWDGTLNQKTLDFLLLLMPIAYAGATAKYHETYDPKLMDEIRNYHNVIQKLYTLYEFPTRFSLRSLIGSVLLNSIIENPSITTVAQLFRLAQKIQLTLDPVSYHGMTDQALIRSRRILFWQIFYLDTITSLHNNLPPLIKPGEFDTVLMTELDHNGFMNPSVCFINAKYRFVVLINELCQGNFNNIHTRGEHTSSGIKERILELHDCCTGSALVLNNHLKRYKAEDPVTARFIVWAVFMLNTFADRSLLLLHLSLIRKSLLMISKRKTTRSTSKPGGDPIIDSGYGQNLNMIQYLLNDNGYLDFSLDKTWVYNYEDLKNNLVPASLHYLDEFIKYQAESTHATFNWELLVGDMPINAITFALNSLALDISRVHKMGSYFQLLTDLRFMLLSKAIPLVESKMNATTEICKHCFKLIKLLFQLIQIKYGNSESHAGKKLFFNKYEIPPMLTSNTETPMVPQPSLGVWANSTTSSSSKQAKVHPTSTAHAEPASTESQQFEQQSPGSVNTVPLSEERGTAATSSMRAEALFDDAFLFSGHSPHNADQTHSYGSSSSHLASKTIKALSEGLYDGDEAEPWGELLSSLNPEPSIVNKFDESQEISKIYAEVQKYILSLSDNDCDVVHVASSDGYYHEFENALLEILCDILTGHS